MFQYVDAFGRRQSITSDDVNDYLRSATAAIFTAIFLPGVIFIPMLAAVLVDRVENGPVAA